MAEFNLNYDHMFDIAGSINTQSGQMARALDDLHGKIEGELADWVGSARDEYEKRQATWNQSAQACQGAELQISQVLHEQVDASLSREKKLALGWAG